MFRADIQGTFRAMNVCEQLWDDDNKVDICKLGAKNAHLDGNRDNNALNHNMIDIRRNNSREYATGRYMAYNLSENALTQADHLLTPLTTAHPFAFTHHNVQPLYVVHLPILSTVRYASDATNDHDLLF